MPFLAAAWHVTLELAPWLLLGAVVAGLLHAVLPRGFVRRHLTGRGAVFKAVALGVPLPLCSCGVIPAGLGLQKDGASKGASLGFLIATPQTGVDSLFVSGSMLGWPFAVFKLASAVALGWIGGAVTDRVVESDGEVTPPTETGRPGLRAGASHAVMIVESIWRWLVFGIVVSALVTVLVPADAFEGFGAYGGALAMLAMLAVAVPLYVCATASVPIAASLVAAGFPPGAALVFLMAGPATNLATIGAVRKAFGGKALAVYLTTVVAGSVLLGWAFEFVLPAAGHVHAHEHGQSWWAVASAVVFLAALGFFAVSDARRMLRRAPTETVEIGVEGMTCNGCVRKLERALAAEPGVTKVHVSREPGLAEVAGSVSLERVAAIVREVGYAPLNAASLNAVSLHVDGMTCNGCVRKLEKALAEEPGAREVHVSREPGRAEVAGISPARAAEIIRATGFQTH